MKVFTCVDHDGYYPVGAATVVVAKTADRARELLDHQLRRRGLKPYAEKPYTLVRLDIRSEKARVLVDGNY